MIGAGLIALLSLGGLAHAGVSTPRSPQQSGDVTLEFRYRVVDASEVLLAWSPPGAGAVNRREYTPMQRRNGAFVAQLRVPTGSIIEYDFKIAKSRDGTTIAVWDTNGDPERHYRVTAVGDTVLGVAASARIEQGIAVQHAENVGFHWRGLWFLLLAFALAWGAIVAARRISPALSRLTPIRKDILKLVALGIATRGVLLLIGYLAIATHDTASQQFAPLRFSYFEDEIAALNYADPVWYREIAERGYDQRPFSLEGHANWSFYPLWPLILRMSGWLSSDLNAMGILVSNLLFLVALGLLYRLIRMDFERDTAIMAVTLLIAFPASYFFSRSGPEALFLLLAVATLYFARQSRWLLAGIFAALGALTKVHGILLLAPLAWLYYRQWRTGSVRLAHAWPLALPVFGLAAFFGYMQWLTGNPLASVAIQQAWGNRLSLPFTGMIDFLSQRHLLHFYGWDLSPISFLFMFGAVILTVIMLRRRGFPLDFMLFTVLNLGVLLARNNLQGSLRYLLPLFPLFLVLALLFEHRRWAYVLTLVTFAALQGFYFAAFVLHSDWAAT